MYQLHVPAVIYLEQQDIFANVSDVPHGPFAM